MKIINGELTTLVAFNESYTEATLSRIQGRVHRVIIPKQYFTMQKLEQFVNLDDDSFIGLADIQAKRKTLLAEQGKELDNENV